MLHKTTNPDLEDTLGAHRFARLLSSAYGQLASVKKLFSTENGSIPNISKLPGPITSVDDLDNVNLPLKKSTKVFILQETSCQAHTSCTAWDGNIPETY